MPAVKGLKGRALAGVQCGNSNNSKLRDSILVYLQLKVVIN